VFWKRAAYPGGGKSCASVRLGSTSSVIRSRDSRRLSNTAAGKHLPVNQAQVKFSKPCQPQRDVTLVTRVDPLLREVTRHSTDGLCRLDIVRVHTTISQVSIIVVLSPLIFAALIPSHPTDDEINFTPEGVGVGLR
jgi:hypothetical protein